MNRLSSRHNRLKFKTRGELPTILEESIEYYTSNELERNRKMSTRNRLDLESLGSWPTLYAQKRPGDCCDPWSYIRVPGGLGFAFSKGKAALAAASTDHIAAAVVLFIQSWMPPHYSPSGSSVSTNYWFWDQSHAMWHGQPLRTHLSLSLWAHKPILRATSHTSQEPWPWNCERPKRKCPKGVPTHLQNHVVWSRTLKCSVKSYVTGPSTKCDFNEFLFMWVLTHDKI